MLLRFVKLVEIQIYWYTIEHIYNSIAKISW